MYTVTNLAVRRVNVVSPKPSLSLLFSLSQRCGISTYSCLRPLEIPSQQKSVKYREFHASGYQMGGRHMKKQPRRSWKLNRWLASEDERIWAIEKEKDDERRGEEEKADAEMSVDEWFMFDHGATMGGTKQAWLNARKKVDMRKLFSGVKAVGPDAGSTRRGGYQRKARWGEENKAEHSKR